jgi:hypothetical protein
MKRIWQKVWKYLDIYAMIFTLVIVVVLGFVGMMPTNLSISLGASAIIVLLIGQLQIRKKADQTLDVVLKERSLFKKAPQSYDQYSRQIKTTRNMFFWGVTLERISGHLSELSRQGGRPFKARFLILKKNGNAVQMECLRNANRITADEINQSLQRTVINLRGLSQKIQKPGSIEVRAIDYLPPWSVSAFDPSSVENGIMFISLLPFRTDDDERPSFEFQAVNNNFWLTSINKQFEEAWKVAEIIDVNSIE